MRITAELIQKSAQTLNPINEFQIDLRGYKIPYIENLTATKDQFGTIDLTDNEITKVPEIPALKQLHTLLLARNRITRFSSNWCKHLRNLENLILTGNKISQLSEVDTIAKCTTLVRLSLVDNLVTKIKDYRLYVVHKMPSLRVLDFQKVTMRERNAACERFGPAPGSEQAGPSDTARQYREKVEKRQRTNELESGRSETLTKERKEEMDNSKRVREALMKAESLEEIKKIEEDIAKGLYGTFRKEDANQNGTGTTKK